MEKDKLPSVGEDVCVLHTPIGLLKIKGAGDKILSLQWTEDSPKKPKSPVLKQFEKELALYFKGEGKGFSAEPFLTGTTFQLAVYEAARAIPYGEVRSYSDIARAIGKPGASRAVGQALHRNRHLLLVPCHRVVAKSGVGGFNGGREIKECLLRLEREGHSE